MFLGISHVSSHYKLFFCKKLFKANLSYRIFQLN